MIVGRVLSKNNEEILNSIDPGEDIPIQLDNFVYSPTLDFSRAETFYVGKDEVWKEYYNKAKNTVVPMWRRTTYTKFEPARKSINNVIRFHDVDKIINMKQAQITTEHNFLTQSDDIVANLEERFILNEFNKNYVTNVYIGDLITIKASELINAEGTVAIKFPMYFDGMGIYVRNVVGKMPVVAGDYHVAINEQPGGNILKLAKGGLLVKWVDDCDGEFTFIRMIKVNVNVLEVQKDDASFIESNVFSLPIRRTLSFPIFRVYGDAVLINKVVFNTFPVRNV